MPTTRTVSTPHIASPSRSSPRVARVESYSATTRPQSLRLNNADIPDLPNTVFKPVRSGKISVTEFPTDGSNVKTTTTTTEIETSENMPLTDTKNHQRVKRVLIPDAADSMEELAGEQQTQLLGLHDNLLDELTDTKDVLQQLQTVVCVCVFYRGVVSTLSEGSIYN